MVISLVIVLAILLGLVVRLTYLMTIRNGHYNELAVQLHERERSIKAKRGLILDRNGVVLAENKIVCNISVIHNQITDREKVIEVLTKELNIDCGTVEKRVDKYTSIEKIKGNVSKEIGEKIRDYHLDGVKVDEEYKRVYPYDDLASKVLGFTGADNQGIIGLEVKYDSVLQGTSGTIYTMTDARGVEVTEQGERREEPVDGKTLITTLDYNIQSYATYLAKQVMQSKQAEHVSVIVMNPQNGEIYAMVDVPEFSLNNPYAIPMEDYNALWRNGCINDTYEPGSVYKIITLSAGLESGATGLNDSFYCPGYVMVGDRKIRCHKTAGHGSESLVLGTMNSCNPVFVNIGLKIGANRYYDYMKQFQLFEKTGIDLLGEASTIMHKKENIKEVELATMSFGQSFQVTPIRLATTVSMLINGGKCITPHVAKAIEQSSGENDINRELVKFPIKSERILSEETSHTVCQILEQVVENGTGKNGYVEGFHVAGKTATSQTLPRGSGRYIASFLGFESADNPQVLALLIIHNPQGVYYGGQVAAPVVRTLFENILPYLSEMDYNIE